MTSDYEPLENIDDSVILDNTKDSMFKNSIVPFFKALDAMRKSGVIAEEDNDFKRDIEFEKLIMDPNFDPENLTAIEIQTLEKYMSYIQTLLLDDNEDKLIKAIDTLKKNSKKKKQRWRDIKKR